MVLQTLSLAKHLISRFRPIKAAAPTQLTPARDFNLTLIPLTLFYSSLTKLFLLFLLTIWTPTASISTVTSTSYPQLETSWLHALQTNFTGTLPSIISDISKVLDDDKLDREWVIRNVLGGLSAGFGLRGKHGSHVFLRWLTVGFLVILDIHPFFSTFIILSGWLSKTAMAQLVVEWVGRGTQMSQAWLAHSIP